MLALLGIGKYLQQKLEFVWSVQEAEKRVPTALGACGFVLGGAILGRPASVSPSYMERWTMTHLFNVECGEERWLIATKIFAEQFAVHRMRKKSQPCQNMLRYNLLVPIFKAFCSTPADLHEPESFMRWKNARTTITAHHPRADFGCGLFVLCTRLLASFVLTCVDASPLCGILLFPGRCS